jgi:hypothetical protein
MFYDKFAGKFSRLSGGRDLHITCVVSSRLRGSGRPRLARQVLAVERAETTDGWRRPNIEPLAEA